MHGRQARNEVAGISTLSYSVTARLLDFLVKGQDLRALCMSIICVLVVEITGNVGRGDHVQGVPTSTLILHPNRPE
jgi:hypothetical protein